MTPDTPKTSPDTRDRMIGRRLGGYVVVSPLGEGGMGKVYLLVHASSPALRRVLKVIHDGMVLLHPQVVERFFREARAAATLHHPSIIKICDYGRFPEDGQPYLEMQFLDGVDLGAYVDRIGAQSGHPGRISFEMALPLLLQVCAALRHAHAHGIIHRDLKPSNCFVVTRDNQSASFRPRVILLDFGIAKVLDPVLRQGDATRSRAVLGTPGYMAPEQARGYEVDHRADIYAFGVMAYEILTGRRPFEGVTSEDLAIQQVSTWPPAPATLVPEIPGRVSELVMHCLAPVPAGRPDTAMEVAHRLIRAARNGHEVARDVAPDLLSPSPIAGPTEPTSLNAPVSGVSGTLGSAAMSMTMTGRKQGRRAAWVALACACVTGVFLLGSRLGQGDDASDSVAAQTPTAQTPTAPMPSTPMPTAPMPTAAPPSAASTPDAGSAPVVAPPPVPDAGTVAVDSGRGADAGAAREVNPVATRTRTRTVEPPPPEPRARVTGTGTLSIKIRPWGLAWVSGRSLGQTPIHESISAGRHSVKLQRPDGTTEIVPIEVKPNQETTLTRDWSK
jgi:eukaryotic-like serine/threonine-protein kinase